MFVGIVFGGIGVYLAIKTGLAEAPLTSKFAGFAFAFVAMALGAVRVQQYLAARSKGA